MKVTLVALAQAMGAMHALSQQKLPFDIAYQVSKLVRKAKGPIEDFTKAEQALMAEYGTPIEGQPGNFTLDTTREAEFREKHEQLKNTEEEIPVKTQLLSSLQNLSIEPGVITPLIELGFFTDDMPE